MANARALRIPKTVLVFSGRRNFYLEYLKNHGMLFPWNETIQGSLQNFDLPRTNLPDLIHGEDALAICRFPHFRLLG